MPQDIPWPSITFSEHKWERDPTAYASRRQQLRHRGSYRAAVTPSISHVTPRLSQETLLELEEATQELVRFDAGVAGIPVPQASLLLRSEAAASSQIEHLTASARAIATADLGSKASPNATLIVRNAAAMQAAWQFANDLSEEAIIAMHAALLTDNGHVETGSWRTQQVWIGGHSLGPHHATFVPPHHDHVPAAMADLVAFMRRDDIPPLAHAAIAHAQFETIHPFTDGNGRTGRALIHALLHAKGVIRHHVVPLSAGFLRNTERYFASFSAYQAGDPEPIALLLAEAVFHGTSEAQRLVHAMQEIHAAWRERLQVRSDALVLKILPELTAQPVVSAPFLEQHFGASNTAVLNALKQLEAADILREFSRQRRNRLWVAHEITAILDDFAKRATMRFRH